MQKKQIFIFGDCSSSCYHDDNHWVVFWSLNMPRLFLSRSLSAETEEEEGAIKLVISILKYFPIISTSRDFDKKILWHQFLYNMTKNRPELLTSDDFDKKVHLYISRFWIYWRVYYQKATKFSANGLVKANVSGIAVCKLRQIAATENQLEFSI